MTTNRKTPTSKPSQTKTSRQNNRRRGFLFNRYHRELRKRVHGRPSHAATSSSLIGLIGSTVTKLLAVCLVILLLLGFSATGLGTGILFGYISTAKDVQIDDITSTGNKTILLDKDGSEIARVSGNSLANRKFVPYSEMQDTYIAKAFIAIEDERFMSHPGIDIKRIGSAIFSALANGGTPTHGGSTITQQTIKLISGADDISAQRKIQEWYNAFKLEQRRSKEGVLDLYLNLVPMSNNIVGVQAAATSYFNKDAKDLNLAECAFLAGIPNLPSTLNPFTEYGRRNALRRMRFTLNKMHELDFISDEEYKDALNYELKFDFSHEDNKSDAIRSYFADYAINKVVEDLMTKLGYSREVAELTVYDQGLTIETTLDTALQAKLDNIYSDQDYFVKDPYQLPDSPEVPQSSIVVIENNPQDPGRVRGMVGGYGKKTKNMIFNRATDAHRQPGSSIKPVLVYAPALETGAISSSSIFVDEPKYLNPQDPNTPYPLNFSRSYMGNVNLTTALVNSLNTVAADVFTNYVGPDIALDYLRRTGIDRTGQNFPAMALGGFAEGVNTLQMAGAYSTLANGGIYAEPSVYTRVLRQDGSVLLDNTEPSAARVYREQVAWIMTQQMTHVADNVGAGPYNLPSAGKTGTSEDEIDKWFCGYTPYYTAAVWYGYDNNYGRRTQIAPADLNNAIGLWRASMIAISEDLPYKDFAVPQNLVQVNICADSGQLAGPYCQNVITSYFEEGQVPDVYCQWHTQPPATTPPTTDANPNHQPPEDGHNPQPEPPNIGQPLPENPVAPEAP